MVRIRKARIGDAPVIQALIEQFAARDEMLHRNLAEICENIRDYTVAEVDGEVLGSCALHVDTPELAEVKALAVSPNAQGMGLGTMLVRSLVTEAEALGIAQAYALTYRPTFFTRLGFAVAEKSSLPHKVWGECVRCRKFPICGEEAMTLSLVPAATDADMTPSDTDAREPVAR